MQPFATNDMLFVVHYARRFEPTGDCSVCLVNATTFLPIWKIYLNGCRIVFIHTVSIVHDWLD